MNAPDCLAIFSHAVGGKCPVKMLWKDDGGWMTNASLLTPAEVISTAMEELKERPISINLTHTIWSVQSDENVRIISLNLETGVVVRHHVTHRLFRKMLIQAIDGAWSDTVLAILQ